MGLVVQVLLALLLIKLPGSQVVFVWIGKAVAAFVRATEVGTSRVFGYLGGVPLLFEETYPGASLVFAFRSLPLVVFIGAIVPERRLAVAQLGMKSILAGTMATCMTGAIAGLLRW